MLGIRCWYFIAILLLAVSTALASAQETERQYLSGHDKDDAVPWKFFCTTGAQSDYWTNLARAVELGAARLRRPSIITAMPRTRRRSRDSTSTISRCPPTGPGSRVFLVFEGVMTDTERQA